MSTVPQIKSETKITDAMPSQWTLYLYATPDAIEDFRRFGVVETWDTRRDFHKITVDARYDFAEVVAYIEAYGKE